MPISMNNARTGKTLFSGKNARIMGILNVTPDSFSDGGRFTTTEMILAQVDNMVQSGADIIDIGGESTRPFATPVPLDEELSRVIPAVKAIRRNHNIPISIDTTKSVVAREALDAGADIINDISALRFDADMVTVVRDAGCPVIIMHMQGTPQTMQVNPSYVDLLAETSSFFSERIAWAADQGIPSEDIIIDPGIGFGKTVEHNLTLIKHLEELKSLGCPLLVGHSRKSFIGKILKREQDDRDLPTAMLSLLCVINGASILRVHDVGKTAQAIRLAEAVLAAP